MKLEEKLLQLCQAQNLTLGLAESCTGGGLAARLTKIPGASKYFAGSIVCYQNHVKKRLLHVPEMYLQQYGAVSSEVTKKILESCIDELSVDIAAAVTGIAGPTGGTIKTPVGTIYIAVGGATFVTKIFVFHFQGSRQEIIEQAIEKALLHLVQLIEESKKMPNNP